MRARTLDRASVPVTSPEATTAEEAITAEEALKRLLALSQKGLYRVEERPTRDDAHERRVARTLHGGASGA